jgi:hypothetical protein
LGNVEERISAAGHADLAREGVEAFFVRQNGDCDLGERLDRARFGPRAVVGTAIPGAAGAGAAITAIVIARAVGALARSGPAATAALGASARTGATTGWTAMTAAVIGTVAAFFPRKPGVFIGRRGFLGPRGEEKLLQIKFRFCRLVHFNGFAKKEISRFI